MSKLYNSGVAAILCAILITPSEAAFLDHGSYSTDTDAGLDWLDLTQTLGMSYNAVLGNLNTLEGGGWRFASSSEITSLYILFGVPVSTSAAIDDSSGIAIQNMVSFFGDTSVTINSALTGVNGYYGIFQPDISMDYASAYADRVYGYYISSTVTEFRYYFGNLDVPSTGVGAWLVRDASAIPLPSAVWLLFSGLIGVFISASRSSK